MANKHAVLSASSSERWLNCPPSARLCENYEDMSEAKAKSMLYRTRQSLKAYLVKEGFDL